MPEAEHGTQAGRKTLASFPNKTAYAEYIKSILQVGMKVVAVSGDRKGDRGKYLGTNGGRPPCHVEWEDFGRGWWVEWHDVEKADNCDNVADSSASSSAGDDSSIDEMVCDVLACTTQAASTAHLNFTNDMSRNCMRETKISM